MRRTVKFLCGLASGQVIVLPSWLDACKRAKSFVGKASGNDSTCSIEHNYRDEDAKQCFRKYEPYLAL